MGVYRVNTVNWTGRTSPICGPINMPTGVTSVNDCGYYGGHLYISATSEDTLFTGGSYPYYDINLSTSVVTPISGVVTGNITGLDVYATSTGIGDSPIVEISSFNLTPSMNPFMSTVTIYGSGVGSIQIFDISGRMILDDDFSGDYIWDASNEVSGMYFVCVTSSVGTSILNVVKL